MKIVQIANSLDFYFNKRLKSLIEAAGHEHFHFNPKDFTYGFEDKSSLNQADLIFHRVSNVHQDTVHLDLLRGLKVRIVNPIDSIIKCQSKVGQIQLLKSLNIKTPKTFILRGKVERNCIEQISQSFKAPFLIKPERGMQGIGVNLIESKEQLFSWLETFYYQSNQSWLVQEYISQALEFRAFVLDGEIKGVIQRDNKSNQFKSNYFQGGEALAVNEKYSFLEETVARISQVFQLDYFALDFFKQGDDFIVIDINPHCGVKQLEEVLQKDFISEILNYSIQESITLL